MKIRGTLLLLALAAAGCSSHLPFEVSSDDLVLNQEFSCEVQTLYLDRAVRTRETTAAASVTGRMLGLEPGSETVAWLYHFEDDGDSLRDEERAFTIAVVLRQREPGRYALRSDRASLIFYCDNWGRGCRIAEVRATSGWLEIEEVGDRVMRGTFDATLEGFKERPERIREAVKVHLRGRFHATP